MTDERPTHLDLFSGIGGFAIAAQCAGFRTIGFCEKEPFCQKVLAQHWPTIPIDPDICQFDGKKYRGVSLLTGGFPCQPFSQAGEQRGKEDDRYLWPEMRKAIADSEPDWIVGENVDGLDGLGLDDCISDLETIGYEVAPPLEIPACAANAPHRRNRIWIIANRHKVGSEIKTPHDERAEHQPDDRRTLRPESDSGRETFADANGERESQSQGRERDIGRWDYDSAEEASRTSPDSQGVGRLTWDLLETSREWKSLLESGGCFGSGIHRGWQPTPDWFECEPRLARLVHGIPNQTHRLEATGNTIVPQVAFQILKGIYQEIIKARRPE